MFKKSKIKIVAAIMSILIIVWVGTLAVIYASSYFETARRDKEMLEEHIALYSLEHSETAFSPRLPMPDRRTHRYSELPEFKLSTFYSVAVSYNGEILEIGNDGGSVYTDEELTKMALDIIRDDETAGTLKNLSFCMADKGGYILVAFMDNTIMHGNMMTLFRYTLIFGGAALAVLFFFAVLLAERIVRPLEESYVKQKRFISDAGHELKTPVSVVNANAEMLSREIGENRWLDNIRYENERMGLLVGQLLDLARTENVEMQTQYLDFSRLVAGEVLPFESVAYEKGLELITKIEPNLFVTGNEAQLKQLVCVLTDNAVSHGEAGRDVTVSLEAAHKELRLSVVNYGEEIPEEVREHLFERFYRADEARSGDDKHYGLGLAIAKAIVTAHKGSVRINCFDGKVELEVRLPNN